MDQNLGKRGCNEDRLGVPNEVSGVIISAWADLQSSPHLVQVRGESKPRRKRGSDQPGVTGGCPASVEDRYRVKI